MRVGEVVGKKCLHLIHARFSPDNISTQREFTQLTSQEKSHQIEISHLSHKIISVRFYSYDLVFNVYF